ncbi:MAG: hypothetical protein KZQ56_03155, partial [gamma proteobacterium symbiont of Lucinoma myriamae]|nr:hypothetical protein [gamma proteobacterium symbiont of Lucinoma myriamae]
MKSNSITKAHSLQYYFSQQMAVSAVHKSFTQAAKRLTQQIQTKNEFTKTSLYLTEIYPDLNLSPSNTINLDTIKRFAHNIEHSQNIYAIYIGQPDDEFFEVINMNISKELHKPKKRSSPCNDIISSTKLLIIELFFSRL